MDSPAAMLHRIKRLGRSFRVKRSGVSSASIIWGFTPRKIRSQRPATSSLMVVLQPSSAARASALAAVRLASQTSLGSTALQTARAMAPPMLPQPKNPMVLIIYYPSSLIIQEEPGARIGPCASHCKHNGPENQERGNGFCVPCEKNVKTPDFELANYPINAVL